MTVEPRIREFRPDDIPGVVALRRLAFQHTERDSDLERAEYIERIFFHNPWRDEAFPSWVYLDSAGRLAGFLGVVPRPARFGAEAITVAVATQFMVDPMRRGPAGIELMRRFLAGPQALSLADLATETSRVLWVALGGWVSVPLSLHWSQTLRGSRLRADGLRRTPFDPEALDPGGAKDHRGVRFQLAYDGAAMSWLLAQLRYKRSLSGIAGAEVTDRNGKPAGRYLYASRGDGTADLIHFSARLGRERALLAHLCDDARRRGLGLVRGRFEPGLAEAFSERGPILRREGPWVLFHTPRGDLREAIERGDAAFSRLDGEWWMAF